MYSRGCDENSEKQCTCAFDENRDLRSSELETGWIEVPEMQSAVGLASSDARWSTCPHLFVHPYILAWLVMYAEGNS